MPHFFLSTLEQPQFELAIIFTACRLQTSKTASTKINKHIKIVILNGEKSLAYQLYLRPGECVKLTRASVLEGWVT